MYLKLLLVCLISEIYLYANGLLGAEYDFLLNVLITFFLVLSVSESSVKKEKI